jgi:hypothetical protein
MRQPWVGMTSFVAVLLVLALGHRWSVTASWFTSDKTCRERHATRWFVQRLDMDCWIVIACSARGYGSFMMKAIYLAAYVEGGMALLNIL